MARADRLAAAVAATLLLFAVPGHAQIPPEWQAAAQVVIGDLEHGTATAEKPWGSELRDGWRLARAWRQYNNGNVETIFAEYLTFTQLCRHPGCADNSVEGRPYREVAAEVKAVRAEKGGSYGFSRYVHGWLAGLDDPSGAAAKNAALWGKDLDSSAADFATSNLYALDWLLARARHTPADQATTFANLALFLQGRAWIGARCLDIAKIATVIGAPPLVESCN